MHKKHKNRLGEFKFFLCTENYPQGIAFSWKHLNLAYEIPHSCLGYFPLPNNWRNRLLELSSQSEWMGVPKVYIDLACSIHDPQSFWWEKILEYTWALEDDKVHHWSNIWGTKCPCSTSDPCLGLFQLPDYLPWHLILDSALPDNAALHNLERPCFGFSSPQKLFLLNHRRCDPFTVDFNLPL